MHRNSERRATRDWKSKSVTDLPTNQRTDQLTGVGARDTCVSKKTRTGSLVMAREARIQATSPNSTSASDKSQGRSSSHENKTKAGRTPKQRRKKRDNVNSITEEVSSDPTTTMRATRMVEATQKNDPDTQSFWPPSIQAPNTTSLTERRWRRDLGRWSPSQSGRCPP